MYQSNQSFNIPPTPPPLGIPWAFDTFSCPGGREFDDELSHLGVGHLITTHRGWEIWSLALISCYESKLNTFLAWGMGGCGGGGWTKIFQQFKCPGGLGGGGCWTLIWLVLNSTCSSWNIFNLHFEMHSIASCPPRFLSVNKARNLSVNGLTKKKESTIVINTD